MNYPKSSGLYDLQQLDSRQYLIKKDGRNLLTMSFSKVVEDTLGQDGIKKIVEAAAKELVQQMVSGGNDEAND